MTITIHHAHPILPCSLHPSRFLLSVVQVSSGVCNGPGGNVHLRQSLHTNSFKYVPDWPKPVHPGSPSLLSSIYHQCTITAWIIMFLLAQGFRKRRNFLGWAGVKVRVRPCSDQTEATAASLNPRGFRSLHFALMSCLSSAPLHVFIVLFIRFSHLFYLHLLSSFVFSIMILLLFCVWSPFLPFFNHFSAFWCPFSNWSCFTPFLFSLYIVSFTMFRRGVGSSQETVEYNVKEINGKDWHSVCVTSFSLT